MSEARSALAVLQTIRLKGRVSPAALATCTLLSAADVTRQLAALSAAAAVTEAKGMLRISPLGRETLAQQITAYNRTLDLAALTPVYAKFNSINAEFKALLTDWQLREGIVNTHTDTAYDSSIMRRLTGIDSRFSPLLGHLVQLVPRLSHYPPRFQHALQRVLGGDHAWFARPITDSYHTIWFELHEDLIGTLGLSRESEAAAGRAE